jgi:O-acetyl-ADP-ribose deacetylase (regulator of RNase III)
MTQWSASVGDLLDSQADALICSANPQLNLSGGVGGAFGLRYGPSMQQFLHDWLGQNRLSYVQPGNVVVAPPCGSPYRAIIHAVAIDAFYETTTEIIRVAYENAFAAVAHTGSTTVASACLACGYGRTSPPMFVNAVHKLINICLPGIDRVKLISTNRELVEAIQNEIAKPNSK